MIRKSRLHKVTFGCCAVIFLILQFLDGGGNHHSDSKDANNLDPVTPSGQPPSLNTVKAVVNLNLSSPLPPLAPPSQSAKKAENEAATVSEEIVKEPRSSLSGERIHGLPNETGPLNPHSSQHNGQIVGLQPEIPKILAQIKVINEEQSIRNEDIFGPVTNATVVIAIQVHNRLQYLRQLIISLSQVFL